MKKGEFRDCDVYAARIAALRPFPKETLKELLRLMGQSIALDDEGVKGRVDEGVNEGVKTLLSVIRSMPGRRANELATLIGKSVQSVERYVKALRDAGEIEFRGAPKNGGYYVTGAKS